MHKQLINELNKVDYSIYLDYLQLPLIHILQMEEEVKLERLEIKYFNNELINIDQIVENLNLNTKISYCYLMIKQFIQYDEEYQKQTQFLKEIEDQQQQLSQKLQKKEFQFVQNLIGTILQIFQQCNQQYFELQLKNSILQDILLVYQVYLIKFYRQDVEFSIQEFLQDYNFGMNISNYFQESLQYDLPEILLKIQYDVLRLSLLYFIKFNDQQEMLEILKKFLDYYYKSTKSQQLLFDYEQQIQIKFLDYYFSHFNVKDLQLIFQQLNSKVKDDRLNVYLFEFYCNIYSWIINKDLQDEQIKCINEFFSEDQKCWYAFLPSLLTYYPFRASNIIARIMNNSQNEWKSDWNDLIFKIVQSSMQITNKAIVQQCPYYIYDDENKKQILIFILDLIRQLNKNNKILFDQFFQLSTQNYLIKEKELQKYLLKIIIEQEYLFFSTFKQLTMQMDYQLFTPNFLRINTSETLIILQTCLKYDTQNLQMIFDQLFLNLKLNLSLLNNNFKETLNLFNEILQILLHKYEYSQIEGNYQEFENFKKFNIQLLFQMFNFIRNTIRDQINWVSLENCELIQKMLIIIKIIYQKNQLTFTVNEQFDLLILFLFILINTQEYMVRYIGLQKTQFLIKSMESIIQDLTVSILLKQNKIGEENIKQLIDCFFPQQYFSESVVLKASILSPENKENIFFQLKLYAVLIGAAFECELPNKLKLQILTYTEKIIAYSHQLQKPFSIVIEKLILSLAIQENHTNEGQQVLDHIVKIIIQSFEWQFTYNLLNLLLKIIKANEYKSLIFENKNFQPTSYSKIKILENSENQKNRLIQLYDYERVLSSVLNIFQGISVLLTKQEQKKKSQYIEFLDEMSLISHTTNLPFEKSFTIYFEVDFQFNRLKSDCDWMLSEIAYRHLYCEILTFYTQCTQCTQCTQQELNGFQILILPSRVKIRQFHLQHQTRTSKIEEQIFVCQNVSKMNININTFQVCYYNQRFQVFINNQKCKPEKECLYQPSNIVQIDFGKSNIYFQSISEILQTQCFQYEDKKFYGKLYQFWVTNECFTEQVSQLKQKPRPLVYLDLNQYNTESFLKFRDKTQGKITNKKVIKVIQSDIASIFIKKKGHLYLLMIIEEKFTVESFEKLIWFLEFLLNKIVFLDDQILDDFFADFNYFQEIFKNIYLQFDQYEFLFILEGFLDKLNNRNKRYYKIFYERIVTDFTFFEKLIEKNQNNQECYFQSILKVSNLTIQQLVDVYLKNKKNPFIQNDTAYQLQILDQLTKKFNQSGIDMINKSLTCDLISLSKFFEIQILENQIFEKLIQFFDMLRQQNYQRLQKYFQYQSGLLSQKVKQEKPAISQMLTNLFKNSFYNNDNAEVNLNFIHLFIFLEDINQNFYKSDKYQINESSELFQTKQFYISDKGVQKIKQILQIITNIKVLCTYINIIGFQLLDQKNQKKVEIIQLLCKKIQESDKIYDIQNQSQIENILDKFTSFKNYQIDIQKIFVFMLLNRLIYEDLSKFHQSLIYRHITQDQDCFYFLFKEIPDLLFKYKSNLITIINIVKFLSLIEFECIKEENKNEEDICKILTKIMKNMYELGLLNFREKWQGLQNQQQNGNYLQFGGLFRIFTNIVLSAAKRNKIEIIIKCGIYLLELYFEAIKENSYQNDRLARDVFNHFNQKQDQKGIQFPILPYLFKDQFQPKEEYLKLQKDQIMMIINKCMIETEKYFKINQYQEEMMKDYNAGNEISFNLKQKLLLEQKQQYQQQNYKISQFFKQQNFQSEITFISTQLSTEDQSRRSSALQLQPSQINKLYLLNYYFNNDVWNQEQIFFKLLVIQENGFLSNNKLQSIENLSWVPTNRLDFENKVIFLKREKQNYQEENSMKRFQSNCNAFINSIDPSLVSTTNSLFSKGSMRETNTYEIDGWMKNIFDDEERVNINTKNLIQFIDPFEKEIVVLYSNDTHVNFVRYEQKDRAVIIRKQQQDFQNYYFIIFKDENDTQQFLKVCKDQNIQYSKQISSDIRKLLLERWNSGKLSNYQYIFLLNYYAGRNLQDRNNYYIYPWTMIQFKEKVIKIDRDFSKIIFEQNSKNKKNYQLFYSNRQQMDYFFQQNTYDLIEFFIILQKRGEAIPEIYTNCQFFENFKLPEWVPTQTPEELIYIMRMQLESEQVQKNLHKWIDLVFGKYSNIEPYQKQKIGNNEQFFNEKNNQQNFQNKDQCWSSHGQSLKQIFTEKHEPRKLIVNYFENQDMQYFNSRKLICNKINSKIISIYYFNFQAIIVIYENGQAASFEVTKQLSMQALYSNDSFQTYKIRDLETTQQLTPQLVCYVDFENQLFSDSQESQYHIIENEFKKLSLSGHKFGFFIAGYEQGEFRFFEGISMKQTVFQTPEQENITCITINHHRNTLIIGQQNSTITLWHISKSLDLSREPIKVINSHTAGISYIKASASKILSIDYNNSVQILLYDGKILNAFQLNTHANIQHCQISYTMNLYIFLDKENNLMAYNYQGNEFLSPVEYMQEIKILIPMTPYSSQFLYLTDEDIYFDDIFSLKMKQDGKILENEQYSNCSNIEFGTLKYMQGQKIIIPNPKEKNQLSTCTIVFYKNNTKNIKYMLAGCENGKLWLIQDDNDIIFYLKQQFESSGVTN